ncbi:protein transport protein Sec16A isoform X4 [Oryzias latipes]
MQPPPRAGPPGASGPPPSGPNMFRRTRPQKSAAATGTMPPATQPMTNPFAFGQAPPPMATGGIPTIPTGNLPQMQTPPSATYSQHGSGLPPQPQSLGGVPFAPSVPPPSTLPGVPLLDHHSAVPPGVLPAPSQTEHTSSNSEQGYFNSRDQTSSVSTESPPMAATSAPSQTHFNQSFQGQLPPSNPVHFQPHPPASSFPQWAPEHTSRPPSVQNYFQPTSDPPPQLLNIDPQPQMYPPHSQSPHHNVLTPPTQPGLQNQPPLNPPNPVNSANSQWSDPNRIQQHSSSFYTQNSFSQNPAPQESWFNQIPQDYHQMGTGPYNPPLLVDTAGSAPGPASGPEPRAASASDPNSEDSGALSMFFKGNDVENEETLAGDRDKTVNGVVGSFQHQRIPQSLGGHADVPAQENSHLPYLSEGSHIVPGNTQKPPDTQFDHVENLECVPNQEVLPSESHSSAVAPHEIDQFETGPNLETPDSVPRPMRSASVSSNYSNMSHGSGTGGRRYQGAKGTFIQQESPHLAEDANPSGAAGGYFEQIDTSPAVETGMQPGSPEHIWPSTPSPPKPTGIFQTSANSSFEPVRSHGVGVRPAEVDRAKMVVEGRTECTSGNLEQPPDNMENIFGPGHSQAPGAGGGVPHATHPVVLSHSRPSSRAFGASRPCDSPATTLWAQNDPASLGVNILLAPAAPTVLAPLREPSADVIQPPEDGPLDLQPPQRIQATSQQHSENLENPPKVSDAVTTDSQGNLGYASLLVSGSLHQPVLIAPPVSNYSVIHAGSSQSSIQGSHRETTPPERSLSQGSGIPQSPSMSSNKNPISPLGSMPPPPVQSPLNLTRDSSVASTSEIPLLPHSHPVHPPLSRGQSSSGDGPSAVQVNSNVSSLVSLPVSNPNQSLNYELLDFSMHQSHTQSQTSGQASLHESPQCNNGFYLQVTKDAQHGASVERSSSSQTPVSSSVPQVLSEPPQPAANSQPSSNTPSLTLDSQAAPQGQISAPSIPVSGAPLSHDQSSALIPERPAGGAITAPQSQGPQGPEHPATSHPQTMEPPRPPSTAGSHHSYGAPAPPVPGQMYGAYYGNYGEYPDNRAQYPPGQYMPPPGDPRLHQYYQDNSYRGRSDPWYGRYEGQSQNYRDPNYQYREPPSDRPNSRASQYSDRPSSRQGYPDESRANRSAYSDYYADYSKHYEYGGYYGQLDPRYRGYYDQSYWSYYDDTYRNNYYNQPVYPQRKEGYEDQWKYYPGYDPSFDDDNRCGGEMYGEDFDRRSIHSEQSAHSVHSSHSHHSRQSSFSSRSQQSQIYRSQPDLTVDVCDNTSMAVNYSYAQYPDQTDATQKYLYSSDYTTDGSWIAPKQPPPRPATPEKFTMPHRCARFGPGGHLVQVLPNLPSAGQPALVDIYNLETMLQDTPDQAELRAFPGPLIKGETHKVDVIKFSQSKGLECSRDNNLLDRDSARLLWDFIVLLCRQNGTVVGTDIADLLLKEHRSVWLPGKSPNEANLIDFNNEPLAHAEEDQGTGPLSLLSDTFMTVPENVGKETERFRELLLFGRKKEALEAAMKAGLWGHALLLASKMDSRTHARVMTKFANSLPMNDPLQTIYQLMSGRMPASATCCGEEKWGDWRPHLAMVLSNLSQTLDLDTRTITTMGDTLASKGLTDAAHFCYLMAQVGLGVFTKKSTKLVLIGSNHSLSFQQFATNEAIQRTEAYEYAQSLGSQPCSLPNFQVFKLIYACRLAEAGLCAQAFHYCEVISKTVLMQPSYYSPVFISQIIQMSEKLRFYDPQLKEKPELEWFLEPDWLIELRQLIGQIWTGAITYSVDRRTPPQFDCRSETSDLEQFTPSEPYSMPLEVDGPAPDNPLTSLLPRPPSQEVRLMPPAPSSIIRDDMGPPQVYPPADPPQFYPVPPIGQPGQLPAPGYPQQDPGITPPSFQPQHMQTAGGHQQSGAPTQVSTHMPPPPGPHSPVQMNPPLFPAQHMPPMEQPQPPLDSQHMMPSPPPRNSLTPQSDFYDYMAHKTAGRTRTISESSSHLSGNSSRRASISSNFSGRERANSVKQVSPPPPPIPEQPRKEATNTKKDSPNKKLSWLKWLMPRRNEAHLPDDKNPSIVWDEKKQRWVDLNEPEEETKPPPPPPSGFPAIPQMPGPGGPAAPPGGVNMFSIKAGSKGRYVDVLNPSRTAKASAVAPAPADLFAPLAPMPMPNNLFVPSSAPDDQQPLEGSEGGNHEQNSPNSSAAQMFNPTMMPPAPEGPPALDSSQSGELSRSSSMSSLSRESPPAQGPAPTGGITFYNPAQFAPTSAPSGGGVRSGRLGGPRQYPTLK